LWPPTQRVRSERSRAPPSSHEQSALPIVLLMIYAWSAGRAAQLRGRQLLLITAVAGALGLVMILLKDVVLIHLH